MVVTNCDTMHKNLAVCQPIYQDPNDSIAFKGFKETVALQITLVSDDFKGSAALLLFDLIINYFCFMFHLLMYCSLFQAGLFISPCFCYSNKSTWVLVLVYTAKMAQKYSSVMKTRRKIVKYIYLIRQMQKMWSIIMRVPTLVNQVSSFCLLVLGSPNLTKI